MMVVVSLLVFFWLGTLTFLLFRVLRIFDKLTKGVSDKDLKSILEQILSEIKTDKEFSKNLEKKINELKNEELKDIKKVGLIRYNPFSETGGNQSFVLVLLDSSDNGFAITSLHSRDNTRVFAKPVVAGKESGFEFSKEEIQAILEAKKSKR